MTTPQEEFWKGDFGSQYAARNDERLLPAKIAFFARALAKAQGICDVIEFGANIGLNLDAIATIVPDVLLTAVEINADACREMLKRGDAAKRNKITVFNGSMLSWDSPLTYTLSLSMGTLIHIAPEDLPNAYNQLYRASSQYILLAEYFNPTPVAIEYRGHKDKLFKRDFASEMLNRFANLRVLDYGFVWRRDPIAPMDDITWTLMERFA